MLTVAPGPGARAQSRRWIWFLSPGDAGGEQQAAVLGLSPARPTSPRVNFGFLLTDLFSVIFFQALPMK